MDPDLSHTFQPEELDDFLGDAGTGAGDGRVADVAEGFPSATMTVVTAEGEAAELSKKCMAVGEFWGDFGGAADAIEDGGLLHGGEFCERAAVEFYGMDIDP